MWAKHHGAFSSGDHMDYVCDQKDQSFDSPVTSMPDIDSLSPDSLEHQTE